MGTTTKIEWSDGTWNPWQGCTKVSDGCKNCYMYTAKKRYGQDPKTVVRSKPPTFNKILKDNEYLPGSKVFVCSWSDFFHQDADQWRDEAWDLMRQRPDLTFQIVTKRPERVAECLPADWGPNGWPNVWLITSVEDQPSADYRIPAILSVPAAVHGLSMEPLLELVDIEYPKTLYPNGPDTCCSGVDCGCLGRPVDPPLFMHPNGNRIKWVIVGGESGPGHRHTDKDWVRSIAHQCIKNGIRFFFKQWGGARPDSNGRELDGLTYSEFPA